MCVCECEGWEGACREDVVLIELVLTFFMFFRQIRKIKSWHKSGKNIHVKAN